MEHGDDGERSPQDPESASHDKLVLAVCALTCLTGLTVILQALVLSLRAYEAAGKEVTEAPTTDEPVIPIHYDLTMRPFTASGIYEGKVRVMLDAVRDTYSVSLDCGLSLNVTAASIRWNDFPVRVSRTARDGQRLTVQTTHPMVAHQRYNLTLVFHGNLQSRVGMVLRRDNHTGQVAALIIPTQSDNGWRAREGFPCYDSPLHKATFEVRLQREKGFRSASNAPLLSTKPSTDGYLEDVFHRTPRMSPHFVHAMVTNFTPQGDDSVQLWASAKDLELVSYVLPLASGSQRVAQRSLGDNAFPRSGLDVAVIRDLGARSIPGWGMLIFSLEALSYNASVDRPSVKSESAALIMHQVLLQWFFAYVTPRSEHDAWMGDALAYAFKRSLLQEQNPRSGQSWRHRLLDRCAVMHAEDIGRPPVWLKPGLVLTMLRDHMPTRFGAGVQRYLKKHAYGVASEVDLWNSLDDSGWLNRHMHTWVASAGYPIVHVRKDLDDHNTSFVFLRQGWQCHNQLKCNATTLWTVPFTATAKGRTSVSPTELPSLPQEGGAHPRDADPTATTGISTSSSATPASEVLGWLRGSIHLYRHVKVAHSSWLLMNPRGIPYYRVAYDDRNLNLLTVQLQKDHAQIAEQNRAILLDDIAALVVQQVVPLSTLLALLRYLQLERSCLVWKVYVRVMRHTLKAFEGRIEYAAFFIHNQELCGLLRVTSAESLCLRLWWDKVCCIGAPRNKPDCEDRDGSVTPRGVTWDLTEPTRSPTPTLEPAQSTGSL